MSTYKDVATSASASASASEHLLGCVKWFNNKTGIGFITVTDGSRAGTDVFVHHSSIIVENQQYKYLVEGEYVEFDLIRAESDKHEFQSSRVSGLGGGKLVCEARRNLNLTRNDKTSDSPVTSSEPKMPRQRKATAPRVRSEGPKDGDKKEWTLVGDKRKPQVRKPRAQVRTTNGSTIITIQSK